MILKMDSFVFNPENKRNSLTLVLIMKLEINHVNYVERNFQKMW